MSGIFSALVALGLAACDPCAESPPVPRGVVFVVGGIGGLDPIQGWAPWALPWAGVEHEVRVFEWTHGKCRLLRDLQDGKYLWARGQELAARVRDVLAREPGRAVYLLGHSAGAGVVLAAAAGLPPGSLERVVVLSAAVSPYYDLRPALRASRGGVVSFHSRMDFVFLDWGTSVFGTADREYGPSAGLDGFRPPVAGLDEEGRRLYAGLVQLPWRWDMLRDFHAGLHHSTTTPHFLARQVAPWLRPCPR